MTEKRSSNFSALLYGGACLFLVVYFLRSYGLETGAWFLGALLYCGCLFLIFPAAVVFRLDGAAALNWLDWSRLAYIPVFLGLALVLASWLPLIKITALGLVVSAFTALVTFRRRRANSSE